MKICYFTATGNCLDVARRFGGELLSIPQLMKAGGEIEVADEAVGIVFPVYACELPMMVREFMGRARIEAEYFFVVCTYGMGGHEEALCHAELAAREAGLELRYANAIQMVDNYLPGFEMQDQLDTLPAKDVEGQLARVVDDILNRRERPVDITPEKQANMARSTRSSSPSRSCARRRRGSTSWTMPARDAASAPACALPITSRSTTGE
ncbi:MAG: EFR1 family ferrodoxin [Coriobacteriales bacterium]|jgi:hypothetical protein